ncbi:MAG: hypothetical protein AB7O49_17360 [Sphingomonadales bacterium]
MKQTAYKLWARSREVKARCRLCQIVLVRGRPPSPCFRPECRFYSAEVAREPVSEIPSSLGGGDYSEIR